MKGMYKKKSQGSKDPVQAFLNTAMTFMAEQPPR
jgi:hypothetical protein